MSSDVGNEKKGDDEFSEDGGELQLKLGSDRAMVVADYHYCEYVIDTRGFNTLFL